MKMIKYIFLAVLPFSFTGCKKAEEIKSTETTVGISKIIFFPTVEIKGERFIILKQGDTYTDAGSTALLNGAPTPVTVGSVNTAVPGVYDLVYEAKNAEGYSASDWRTVVVIGNDVTANNFSGTYNRVGFAPSTWTKTANGVYSVDNPGGALTGVGYKVIMVNYQGNKIRIPKQIASDPTTGPGIVSSGSETYNNTATPSYSLVFFAGGYGTGVRTFIKQ